jgi:hypothetical protein
MYIKISLLFVLIFGGCTSKDNKITIKDTTNEYQHVIKEKKQKIVKDINTTKEQIVEPKKTVLDSEAIAIVFPSLSIGKYALEASNSVSSYLLMKKIPFTLEVVDFSTQTKDNIQSAIKTLIDKKINKAILMITKDYLQYLDGIEIFQKFLYIYL